MKTPDYVTKKPSPHTAPSIENCEVMVRKIWQQEKHVFKKFKKQKTMYAAQNGYVNRKRKIMAPERWQ